MSFSTVNDLLNINPRFLRSTQLERDFSDPSALEGYVVTPEVQTYLRRLAKGLRPESSQRAWRITGDFGSGKSSFALMLANLLGRPASELPKRLWPLRNDLGLGRGRAQFLPILATGTREPIAIAILRSLFFAIDENIDGRKKLKCRVLLAALLQNTDGLTDAAAIAAIVTTSQEVVEKQLFSGLLIVIDELGKFLEFAALRPEQQDVYFLQLLGEASSRSGTAPILTVGLLHQGFSAYAGRLSSSAQKEWEKVGGRFDGISFAQPLTQTATLISQALGVELDEELRGWKTKSRKDMALAVELGIFGASVGKTALVDLAPTLYPLHPTLLPVLSKFFRRFGQNERSLFSFLLSSEPNALPDFATRLADPNAVYRLSYFYDFAAENFSHRLSAQSFRSHWNHIDSVIRSHPDQDGMEIQILKTVGILNIVESHELLPTRELLSLALGDPPELESCLRELTSKKRILFNRGLKRGFSLWPNTSVNLEQAFVEAAEQRNSVGPIAEVIRERLDNRPIVARRHYISTGTLRHFDVQFHTVDEFAKIGEALKPSHPADGVLVVILCEKTDDGARAQKLMATIESHPQVVVAVSPALEGLHGHVLELEQWQWVQSKTLELKDDRFAAAEVSRQISGIAATIDNWLQLHFNFRGLGRSEKSLVRWYYKGEVVESLNEGGNLQQFLSELCSKTLFPKAPRVHNELVNRHAISSSATSARNKLFGAMLEKASQPMLGIPEDKAPPEKSMYLSVLREGQLHHEDSEHWQIAFPNTGAGGDPCCLLPALEAIVKILEEQADARVNLRAIYTILRSPEFGIRDGLIPILLLVVFIVHESEMAIYEDGVFVPDVEEVLWTRLARAPFTFEMQLCRINGVRKALIEQLTRVVETEKATTATLLSIVRPLCLFVSQLPDYVRNTTNLSPETLEFRNAIENAKEPSDLIFSSIPKALGFNESRNSVPDSIKFSKAVQGSLNELKRAFPELQSRVSQIILEKFEAERLTIEQWRSEIASSAETVLVGVNEAELRSFCFKLADENSPEQEWLEALGSMIAHRPPSKWRDLDEGVFRERFSNLAGLFKRVLATYFDKDGSLPDSAIRLAITPRNGDERDHVIKLSAEKRIQSDELRKLLRSHLGSDKETSLAALSQLVWDIIEEK